MAAMEAVGIFNVQRLRGGMRWTRQLEWLPQHSQDHQKVLIRSHKHTRHRGVDECQDDTGVIRVHKCQGVLGKRTLGSSLTWRNHHLWGKFPTVCNVSSIFLTSLSIDPPTFSKIPSFSQ